MAEVESFTLDHNQVIAPYVRVITTETRRKRR
jgi:S-ribosylhomocysteine lyase